MGVRAYKNIMVPKAGPRPRKTQGAPRQKNEQKNEQKRTNPKRKKAGRQPAKAAREGSGLMGPWIRTLRAYRCGFGYG